jgi:hypothetical protein
MIAPLLGPGQAEVFAQRIENDMLTGSPAPRGAWARAGSGDSPRAIAGKAADVAVATMNFLRLVYGAEPRPEGLGLAVMKVSQNR